LPLLSVVPGNHSFVCRLIGCLRPMASLTKLDISRNEIRIAGLVLLTDALRDHAGFAKLILVTYRCLAHVHFFLIDHKWFNQLLGW
jgi:hypothetical protein